MNKSYALVWNQALGCWNVASELTRRRGKPGSGKALAAAGVSLLGLLGLGPAFALPGGSTVVAGSGTIQTSADGKHMIVDQQTDKLVTNWNDFSVAGDERVSFHQPGHDSIALNRVIGTSGSDIQGRIDANGKVFLLNPNGVVFGKSAQVNVGGLVASTRDIADKDFLDGNYRFTGNSSAAISNAGTLTASEGGSIALLGAQVGNSGVIQAQLGSVALGAGKDFTVNFDGNGLLNLQVDGGVVDALVHNGGLVRADGGQVLMTASSADSLLKTVVSNEGVIEARTLQSKAGRIVLDGGDNGVVQVAGKQDASALGSQGDGGRVENRGASVQVRETAEVDTRADQGRTGTWKIAARSVTVAGSEPATPSGASGVTIVQSQSGANVGSGANGVTIVQDQSGANVGSGANGVTIVQNQSGANVGASANGVTIVQNQSGGNVDSGTPTKNGPTLHADTLARNLATTHIELVGTEQGLKVDAPVTWNGGNRLSLTAERGDVSVDGALAARGDNAGLSLRADQGSIHLNEHLSLTGRGAGLELNHAKGYSLQDGKAVTLSGEGAGFRANGQDYKVIQNLSQLQAIDKDLRGQYVLGNRIAGNNAEFQTLGNGTAFTGTFDGLGNTLDNLSISGTSAFVGLFGVNKGTIRNLNLDRISASGARSTHYNTQVGALAAINFGTVSNVEATRVRVTGASHNNSLGGLVAMNVGNASLENSSVSGEVIGNRYTYAMGGLAGENISTRTGTARIVNSHSEVRLSGRMSSDSSHYGAGGLVGNNLGGQIVNSSSQGSLDLAGDGLNLGGLVGINKGGSLANVESSVSVSGAGRNGLRGGLVGFNDGGALANASASGNVSGNGADALGGLVGKSQGGAVSNGSASGEVGDKGSRYLGGLVGYNAAGLLTNVVSSGNVTGGANAHAGGLVGFNANGSLVNATARGQVSAGHGGALGGLIGHNVGGSHINVAASGDVTGGAGVRAGGLIGVNAGGSLLNASAKGKVSTNGAEAIGGLIGQNLQGTLNGVNASGDVLDRGSRHLGGLIGHSDRASISNAEAHGAVVGGANAKVGGLIGYSNDASIRNARAYGNVSGGAGAHAGGLVGYLAGRGSAMNVSASGSVTAGAGSQVGGLVGVNSGRISNASASGKVSSLGGLTLGGLVGWNDGYVSGSSASGQIDPQSPNQLYGGLIGINFGRQVWNSVHGAAASAPAIGLDLGF